VRWKQVTEIAALTAVLAWGGFLRLGWPGVNPFAFDEARLSQLALELARRGQFPATGPVSSTGVPNFPASAWLFAIPYAFSANPLVAISFIGLLSTLGILALWWMARSAWGPWAGLTTALLAAGSPYLVFYSRNIWGQDWLPILAVAWALAGVLGFGERRRWAIAIHSFLAAFAFQVHYAGIVLLIPTLLLALRFRLKRAFSPWLMGLGAALLVGIPWGVKVLSQVGNIGRACKLEVSTTSFKQFAALATGYNWDWLFLGEGWHLSSGPLAVAMAMAAGGLVSAGLLRLLALGWRSLSSAGEQKGLPEVLAFLVPIWGLISPVFWLAHITTVHIHYHLVSLPAAFLAAGHAATLSSRRFWRIGVIALALAISLGQGILFARGLSIAGEQATPGGISTPLCFHQAAVRFVEDGNPVLVIVPGNRPEFDGDAAVFHVLLWDYPHRLVDGRSSLIIPSHPSWLLFVAPWIPAWEEALGSLPDEGWEAYNLPRRVGEYPYGIIRLRAAKPRGFQPARPVLLANGVQLEGWKAHPLGEGFRFATLWKVADVPERDTFHQFNHLYVEGKAEPVAIHDVPTSSTAWARGDFLIVWADFPKSPSEGKLRMAVGMYRYPSLERVPRVGGGDPFAPIVLGPFEFAH